MKKVLIFVLFVLATTAHAQVDKMMGQWNTFDDKTGNKASIVLITEKNGVYSCVIQNLYQKKADGTYDLKQPPYSKEDAKAVGAQLFIEMKEHKGQLKGKIYDPESGNTYFCKVTYEPKTDELIIRGSLDKAGLLGRSQTWKRNCDSKKCTSKKSCCSE